MVEVLWPLWDPLAGSGIPGEVSAKKGRGTEMAVDIVVAGEELLLNEKKIHWLLECLAPPALGIARATETLCPLSMNAGFLCELYSLLLCVL